MKRVDRMMYRVRNPQGGFSLIELMIVVAIIAVLSLIAYPSYVRSVREGKRGQAKADLVTLANSMERCFTQSNSYALCTLSFNTSTTNGQVNYNIALANLTATTFTIQAAPAGDQLNDPCGQLSVDQAGNRLPNTSSVGGACF